MVKSKHFFIFILALIISEPTYAYLDPGTASMTFQLILAGLASVAVFGKLFWYRLIKLFRLIRGKTEETDQKKDTVSKEADQ